MSDTTTTRTVSKLVYDGYAAEDIKADSTVLLVICPELMPGSASGTLGAGISQGTASLKTRDGVDIKSPVTTTNHLVATWEGGSNMRYPPMVRKGEPVEIYKTANQDKYFWRTTGRGREFRKTDRIAIEIGATDPTKPSTGKDDDNTYSAYLDSDGKKMGLKSSQANGEVAAFSVEFDLAEGTLVISDNSPSPGNRIFLDVGAKSGLPMFQVNLTSGAAIKIEGENAMISIPKKLLINAGERIVFNSPMTVFNLSQAGVFIVNAANIALNAAKDVILTAPAAGINAAGTKIAGVLVAAAGRIANLVKGPAGSDYSPTTVNRPQEGLATPSSNSPDTSMSGTPYQS